MNRIDIPISERPGKITIPPLLSFCLERLSTEQENIFWRIFEKIREDITYEQKGFSAIDYDQLASCNSKKLTPKELKFIALILQKKPVDNFSLDLEGNLKSASISPVKSFQLWVRSAMKV